MDAETCILDHLNHSMSILSKFFYRLRAKTNRKKGMCLYRIAFKKTGGLAQTFIHYGQNRSRPMKYSISYNEYYIELWLMPKSEFFISQKSQIFLIDSFPQNTNSQGKLVNLTPKKKSFYSLPGPKNFLQGIKIKYYLESSGFSIGKLFNLNEDAFFCTDQIIGVADGIGSLRKEFGISSMDFAQELMSKCEEYSSMQIKQGRNLNCKEIIGKAYESLECGGSCTFLLAGIVGRQLNILNLGDCGMILLRFQDGLKIVMRTTAKFHRFNTPYQISRRFSERQMKGGIGKNIGKSDTVGDADEFLVSALPGDFIVAGSDGLWDNAYPEEIIKIIEQNKNCPVSKIAALVGKIAKIRSIGAKQAQFLTSPNSSTSRQLLTTGGKTDDITVIIARIQVS